MQHFLGIEELNAEDLESLLAAAAEIKRGLRAAAPPAPTGHILVNLFFESITEALSKGEKVELRGFGSFRVKRRKSRQGRNPKTGASVKVPEKVVPFFKPGKAFKGMVN